MTDDVVAQCTEFLATITIATSLAPPGQKVGAALAAGAPPAIGGFVRLFRRLEGRNTQAIVAARDESFHEYVEELRRALPDVLTRLRQLEGHQQRLAERVEDPQFARLLDNFGVEASREAIDERRRMLAHAAAGAFNVGMTIAEAARGERVLRELDPADVEALRAFRPGERDPDASRLSLQGLEVLIGAGCLAVSYGAGGFGGAPSPHYAVTSTGQLVLRLTASYEPRL